MSSHRWGSTTSCAIRQRVWRQETAALLALHFADQAVVVTDPEVSSVRYSERILGSLDKTISRALKNAAPVKAHLLTTRYSPSRVADGQMLSIADIQGILKNDLLGVVPGSEEILAASSQAHTCCHPPESYRCGGRVHGCDRLLPRKQRTTSIS